MDNVTLRTRCMAAGVYDHGYVLADEKVADHTPGDGRPKQRLWRIRAAQDHDRDRGDRAPACPLRATIFPASCWRPAVRDYVVNYAVSPGDRTVVVTNNDDAYRTAIALKEAGLERAGDHRRPRRA